MISLEDFHVIKMLPVGNPHGSYFSPTLNRLFVVDGAGGEVKVFDGTTFAPIGKITLTAGADGLAYNPSTNLIYVSNGGEGSGMEHAVLSVIDPVKMEKATDIEIATSGIEGVAINIDRNVAYVNLDEDDRAVALVDLGRHQVVAKWELPGRHRAKGIAFDKIRNRLYVACRDTKMHGSVVVLDATSGRAIKTLPIRAWADGIYVDQKRGRIYVSSGLGYLESFAIGPKDTYRPLPAVETAMLAKTMFFSPDLDRVFVDVPHVGEGTEDGASIMIFKPVP
ncbi:hypothetical protein GCM10009087_30080 [Sphingomonas oligophenolica]